MEVKGCGSSYLRSPRNTINNIKDNKYNNNYKFYEKKQR